MLTRKLLSGVAAIAIAGIGMMGLDAAWETGGVFGSSAWAQGQRPEGKGHQGGGGGGQGGAQKGGQGAGAGKSSMEDKVLRGQGGPSADSDRPAWAGVKGGKGGGGGRPPGAGTKKGDLYGDLYVIVRNDNGEPVLVDGLPVVYAYVTDSSGNLIPLVVNGVAVTIPRDEEGNLLTTVTVAGTTYTVAPKEVELGRTNVSRAPSKVLQNALDEALTQLNATGAVITLDPSGRITVNGVTIDSPIANLALYVEMMNPGLLTGTISATLPTSFNVASLLAAASDKTGTISVDYLVYINSILKVNTVVGGTTTSYYDFSTYNYDRYTTWKDATATVLILKDGVYVPTVVNIYDQVFSTTNWVDPSAGGADDFAQAADDYLKVISYLHDNAVR